MIDLSEISVPTILQNAAILTILVAFAGYALTFVSAHMLARRRDKLDLVNKRLNEFYGPLYVASQAGNIAYRSLLNKQGKTQSEPITDQVPARFRHPCGGLQGGPAEVGGQRLHGAPFDDRLAARIRCVRNQVLCGAQGRADAPDAEPGAAIVAPLDRKKRDGFGHETRRRLIAAPARS
jgi:hypothetical protein